MRRFTSQPTPTILRQSLRKLLQRNDRRRFKRSALCVLAEGQPLSETLALVGQPLAVMTQDISPHGIGFVSKYEILTKYVLLDLPSFDGCIAVELMWSKAISAGLYRYGAKWR